MSTSTSPDAIAAERWDPPLPDAPGFEHRAVRTPGLLTHVASIGRGEPLILLHGFPEHWWQWRDIAPQLARAGFEVFCPDLRGAGWTHADDIGMTKRRRLDDLIVLMDALGIERAHIVSHDMGAITAMQLAYAHPERVKRMVQLSVPPGFLAFTAKLLPAFVHLPPLIFWGGRRSPSWTFSPKYLAHPLTEAALAAYTAAEARPEVRASVRPLCLRLVCAEAFSLMAGVYRRRRLHPPMLVAFGRQDGPFSEPVVRHISRNSERFADDFALAFIDDAAHFVTDDAPDAVAAAILDWVGPTSR